MAEYLPHVTASKTRFAALGFAKVGKHWRFVALDYPGDDGWHGGGTFGAIGPYYYRKDELLADLARFAAEYGATAA